MLGALDIPDVPTGALGAALGGVEVGGVEVGGVEVGGVEVGGVEVGGVVVGGVVVGGVVGGGVALGGVDVGGVDDGGVDDGGLDGGLDVEGVAELLPALPITGLARMNSRPDAAPAPPVDPDWRQPVTVTDCWLPAALD